LKIQSRKKIKRITGVTLCLALVLSCALPGPSVRAVTSESIREKEREIEKAKEEVSGLKNSKTDVEKLKKELEQSKNDLTAYVQQLDGQLADIQEKIAQYNTMITEKEKEIEETARELGLDPHDIVKLASNENPLGPSPKAVEAIARAGAGSDRYMLSIA